MQLGTTHTENDMQHGYLLTYYIPIPLLQRYEWHNVIGYIRCMLPKIFFNINRL